MPISLKDDVREILARSTIDANTLRLPEQLAPKTYANVKKVIEAAGGKWDRKRGLHVFTSDPRAKLGIAIETGRISSDKRDLGAFFTPPQVADFVAELSQCRRGSRVLEPSCGGGALVAACIRRGVLPADITCIDIADRSGTLPDGVCFTQHDFLTFRDYSLIGKCDAVVMNPPFARGVELDHVRHALEYLNRGGMLVAILPPTWQTGERKALVEFRAAIEHYTPWTQKLPVDSFKESGTRIATMVLVLRRP